MRAGSATIMRVIDNMKVEIYELLEGARKAWGTVVIIDVFRAFTMESYAFGSGARRIYPVGDIEQAYRRKREDANLLLAGERGGVKQPGFDFGNSPFEVQKADLRGKTLVHTTSAGTQGVAAAIARADELLLGALVNARATAQYIRAKNPRQVSLVAMGLAGVTPTEEDLLCAQYLKALLEGRPFDTRGAAERLQAGDGARFFRAESQDSAPQEDFWLSLAFDRFSFALPVRRDENGDIYTEPVSVQLPL